MSKVLIVKLIMYYSAIYGFDGNTALAVAKTESGLNPNAIGLANEVGIFQLKPQYVTEYTRAELFDPVNNIKAGIKRLKETKRQCVHKQGNSYLVCYNMGTSAAKRIRHPNLFPYVKKVNALIAMENL